MLTLPRSTSSTAPWFRQKRWIDFLEQSFKYYSGKRNFILRIGHEFETAAVHLERKVVYLNPQLPACDLPGVRGGGVLEIEHRTQMLRGLLAHEAGHVRYTTSYPVQTLEDPRLHRVVNLLEDERIERAMAREYLGVGQLFDYLGDVYLACCQPTGALLWGCLTWRWEHDWEKSGFPRRWTPDDPELWECEVRPRVESAWSSENTLEVARLAAQILEFIPQDLPQNLPQVSMGGLHQIGQGIPGPGETSSVTSPEEDEGDEEEVEMGGNGVGKEAPPEPPEPPLRASASAVEGYARRLAPLLAPLSEPVTPSFNRASGRFRFERHYAGLDKEFERRSGGGRAGGLALTLLLDTSGSMDGPPLECALLAALMLARASSLVGGRCASSALTTRHTCCWSGENASSALSKCWVKSVQAGVPVCTPRCDWRSRQTCPGTCLT